MSIPFRSSYNGSQKSQTNKAELVSLGDFAAQDPSNFAFGEQTTVFGSCSASLYGKLYVFGGSY